MSGVGRVLKEVGVQLEDGSNGIHERQEHVQISECKYNSVIWETDKDYLKPHPTTYMETLLPVSSKIPNTKYNRLAVSGSMRLYHIGKKI